MKVVLAYDYDGHKADETVDLDDALARVLLREGNARPTPQKIAADERRDAGTNEKG